MIGSLLAGLHTLTCVVADVSSITFLLLLLHTIPTLHEQQRARYEMNKKKDGCYWEVDPVRGLLYDHRATCSLTIKVLH